MSEVKRYSFVIGGRWEELVRTSDHDALAAQRDEGLAREAELRLQCGGIQMTIDELEQRLAEAEKLLRDLSKYQTNAKGWQDRVDVFLASPGCADGEKAQ